MAWLTSCAASRAATNSIRHHPRLYAPYRISDVSVTSLPVRPKMVGRRQFIYGQISTKQNLNFSHFSRACLSGKNIPYDFVYEILVVRVRRFMTRHAHMRHDRRLQTLPVSLCTQGGARTTSLWEEWRLRLECESHVSHM